MESRNRICEVFVEEDALVRHVNGSPVHRGRHKTDKVASIGQSISLTQIYRQLRADFRLVYLAKTTFKAHLAEATLEYHEYTNQVGEFFPEGNLQAVAGPDKSDELPTKDTSMESPKAMENYRGNIVFVLKHPDMHSGRFDHGIITYGIMKLFKLVVRNSFIIAEVSGHSRVDDLLRYIAQAESEFRASFAESFGSPVFDAMLPDRYEIHFRSPRD